MTASLLHGSSARDRSRSRVGAAALGVWAIAVLRDE